MAFSLKASLRMGRLFWSVVGFRCAGALLAVWFINALLPLGTSRLAIDLFAIAGIIGASLASRSRLTSLGFFGLLALSALAAPTALWASNWALSFFSLSSLFLEDMGMHAATCGMALLLSGAATWFFWRARSAITVETIALLALSIALFSGHRDFHLDRPKIIHSIAWRIGIDQLSMLFVAGSLLISGILTYLFLASRATRPRADDVAVHIEPAKRHIATSVISLALLALLVLGIQRLLYSHFNSIMLSRIANGVGMGSKDGVSPLTFQSALGSSSQPAALVRLEGDYNNNPFSPMMYLRETALSSFNGKELVFAGRAFDTDLPVVRPQDSFTGKEDAELSRRVPLVQSVYLLADHDNAFALDYPVSIVQLKNPKPTRFKGSYRAYSIGPAYTISELRHDSVGDPRWTPDVQSHFLVPHPDPRYKNLAEEITKGISDPVEKAEALAEHLSKTSIYTLTPRHEVKSGEDPVAPFLFGDHRGYCVHFAHAMVYMLRAIGIPARVGTGYLTDLSQAKDGHILLRMSDRHAWSEVYVTGVGWVPFDIQPEQVESHAETQVDAKMLEELMGILQPGEELLPRDLVKDEEGYEEEGEIWIPDAQSVLLSVYMLLAVYVATKIFLRLGWRIVPTPSLKLRLAYISRASALCDLGVTRRLGETRLEFSRRVHEARLAPLADLVVAKAYSPRHDLSSQEITTLMASLGSPLANAPRWKRAWALISPSSVFKLLGGGGW